MSGFTEHKVWHGSPWIQNTISPGSTGKLEIEFICSPTLTL